MKPNTILLFICTLLSILPFFAIGTEPGAVQNLISPPETETDNSITVLWDKPLHFNNIKDYAIYLNGTCVDHSKITNYTINRLKPNRRYSVSIVTEDLDGKNSVSSKPLKVKTKPYGKIFNVLNYGAKPDSNIVNTRAIQKAIDDCSVGGTVYIPAGTFLSGALFLKSDMTLYIAKGGVLKGSLNRDDYLPFMMTRFEGWELETYSSLITAGKLDHAGPYNAENISIRGEGKISGGGIPLCKSMIATKGLRGRGRLIYLTNCENVTIQGLTIEESPCWTIHYTYSKNIICQGLHIFSTVQNGDGIDPDSSVDSYIFNCSFSTGDDCIAIKSGKNPEGNIIAKPCENIFISNCNFQKGHSLAIGSEISGGIKNVKITDCELGNLWFGLQVKTTNARGGYVDGLLVNDCNLQQIKIVTSLPYNNDGASAPDLTRLDHFEFRNLDMTNARTDQPVIFIEGFSEPDHYAKNIKFENIKLPVNSKVMIKHARDITFENVKTDDGQKPEYNVSESLNVKYGDHSEK